MINADASAVLDELLPIYVRLDQLIAEAAGQRPPPPTDDPYRGLYVAADDVARLLARTPGAPSVTSALPAATLPSGSRLAALQAAFGLSDFELDLLLIAIAAELDLRYERLFAFLHDDVTRRRPSLDLALDLLCRTAAEKLARRVAVDAAAPLLRHRLLRLQADPAQTSTPWLAQTLEADPQIVRWLLRQPGLDPRLAAFCQLDPDGADAGLDAAAINALADRLADEPRLRLHLQGPAGVGCRDTLRRAAVQAGRALLIADLDLALEAGIDLPTLLPLLFREARLRGAVLGLDGVDALHEPGRRLLADALAASMAAHPGALVAIGVGIAADGWQTLALSPPDRVARLSIWHALLAEQGAAIDDTALRLIADRYPLDRQQMRAALRGMAADGGAAALSAAVRAQCGAAMAGVARKVDIRNDWADLMLPADTIEQLRELCLQARQQRRVHEDWGYAAKLGQGRGIAALFAGGSGTGKTMAASIVARELGLDLYRIDLSQVVNKYIGETEKNLERVFAAAEAAQAILLFDEADALFGKRSEVKDAHDRYANLEVGYLLQRMEDYDGLAILATNLRQNLDDAFLRRLSVIVDFPFPDQAQRLAIWRVLFPAAAPLAADVDFAALARSVTLSGGHLRNIALAAAYRAADAGSAISQAHLWAAVRREYQKLGRNWNGPVDA